MGNSQIQSEKIAKVFEGPLGTIHLRRQHGLGGEG